MNDEIFTVMLADDHQMINAGIRALLEKIEGVQVVAEASDGKEALNKFKEFQPDLVLMDISMPEMDGVEATREILVLNPDARILALTMHDEETHIIKMLKAGAFGYILKNTDKDELVRAVESVKKGEAYFTRSVSDKLTHHFMKNKEAEKRKERATAEMTRREVEILRLIAKEYTNQEIADQLFISARTVDTHRRNLLQKLNVKNTAGLVRYAYQNNLLETE